MFYHSTYKLLRCRSLSWFSILHLSSKTYSWWDWFCRLWWLLFCPSTSTISVIISCNIKNIFNRPIDICRLFKCNSFWFNRLLFRYVFIKSFEVFGFSNNWDHSYYGFIYTYSNFPNCIIRTSFHFVCSLISELLW